MSGLNFIKGLVEEGIKKIIEDEVKKRLDEMFPKYKNDPFNRWGRDVEAMCVDVLRTDPAIREIVRGHMVHVLAKHVEQLKAE